MPYLCRRLAGFRASAAIVQCGNSNQADWPSYSWILFRDSKETAQHIGSINDPHDQERKPLVVRALGPPP